MSWQAAASLVLAVALLGGFLWYERSRPPARVLALVAALAALAVVGRLAFAAFPNVKPTTDIVLFAGYALGAAPGFAVGAVTAIVSNVFMSQGPWTVWQMAGWGGVGIGGAALARLLRGREPGRVQLAIACGAAGLAFGAWMDVYQWTLAARQSLDSYVVVAGSSLPYNLAHAVGNVVFCLVIGPAFVRALGRYRRRFEFRWVAPAPAATAVVLAVLAVLVVAVGLVAAPTAGAASSSAKAVSYLKRAQNRDGGLGGARGQGSNQLMSGWAALGLASARVNPRDVKRRGGRASLSTYIRRGRSLDDTGELERTMLVLKAAGLSPRRFRGRDLVARLARRQRPNGSWGGNVGFTAFGVLAMRAAGKPRGAASVRAGAAYLAKAQNGDGGYGFVPSAASDVDDTGAAIQALATAGRGGGAAADAAVRYLRATQGSDGGFPQMKGRSSNAQSTAWAVQGLVAARAGGVDRPIAYLKGLQRADGAIRYSRSSSQTPVWVTAQALTALRREPFPLGKVKRKRRKEAAAVAGASRGAAVAAKRRARKRKAAAAAGRRRQDGSAQPRSLGPVPLTAVPSRPASERSERASAPLIAGVAAITLVLVGLLRLWLRRDRAAGGSTAAGG